MSTCKVKCKKCHCIISEDSVDRLCDNCNMDLIAQNLAAEMSQHEIHRESVELMGYQDDKIPETNKGVEEIDEPGCTREPELPVADVPLSVERTSESIKIIENENSEPKPSSQINEATKCKDEPELTTDKQKENNSTVIIIYDESSAEVVECEPVTQVTPTKVNERRSSVTNDRKRKLEDIESPEKVSKLKEENSSSDESDCKNMRVEPMRTRAKVVQEEAAAMRQHDIIEDDKNCDNEDVEEDDDSKGPVTRLTRKALAEIEKLKHPCYEPVQTKSRRTKSFKSKPVYKAPTSQASIYSSDYVFYKGTYYQSGDVVMLHDIKRPGDFYAQITSFLTDQYCHKCATIQWLFPTKQSPHNAFDPRTYFLGYLDETPRPLSALQPVMHLPSDYYRFNKTPYPPPTPDPLKKHFLWKRTEPVDLEALLQG